MDEITYMVPGDLVLMLKAAGQVYVYPQKEMYVEIVNEDFGNGPVAITFCPQTRSGLAWSRIISTDTLVLTSSGYLLLDNMMPIDTVSGTLFSQMLSIGFDGALINKQLESISLIQTVWETVSTYFPEAMVFNGQESVDNIGVKSVSDREGNYLNENLLYGLFETKGLMLYSYDDFAEGLSVNYSTNSGVVNVIGSKRLRLIAAFKTKSPLLLVEDNFPIVLESSDGTQYDIFGEAVTGPGKGAVLEAAFGYVAADWAWELFYPQDE